MINKLKCKDEEVTSRLSDPSKKLVEYITDWSDLKDQIGRFS